MALNNQWKWRDGLALKVYGGVMIMIAGWNPTPGVFPTSNSTNEIWVSLDYGVTWMLLGEAPWIPRHRFGCEIIGTKLYVWGGDYFFTAEAPRDMWVYDFAVSGTGANLVEGSAWTQLTADWGEVAGNRMIFAATQIQGCPAMFGGQNNTGGSPIIYTDGVKYNFNTNEFEKICDLPISHFATGDAAVNPQGHIFLAGGGRYADITRDFPNDKLLRSTDNGATFQIIGTLPAEIDGLFYLDMIFHQGRLFILNGASPANNRRGLFHQSPNGVWIWTPTSPLNRHASSLASDGTDLYICSGNTVNDVIKVTKSTI